MSALVLALAPKVIIPLNNHLNMLNAIVSLMTQSELCDRKCVISMYVPKINMPFKCQICQLAHVHISQLCQYINSMQ